MGTLSSAKPRVFIGSAREHLNFADAVQQNLHLEFETSVWDQDVFTPMSYPLDALSTELDGSDFGIFILAPADIVQLRGKRSFAVRDNVIFELGMFVGKLGRQRSFIITPQHRHKLHLPTDLLGITPATYDANRRDGKLSAALGPACHQIGKEIQKLGLAVTRHPKGLIQAGLFPDFDERFRQLIPSSSEMTLYFIHSRRWREIHTDSLTAFFTNRTTRSLIILPDLKNHKLIATIQGHFDDGPHIPGFIADAYRYFSAFQLANKSKIKIRLSQIYPTYSFYLFDKTSCILAMYPTTTLRKSVPTFEIKMDGEYGQFVSDDIKRLMVESRETSTDELLRLAKKTVP